MRESGVDVAASSTRLMLCGLLAAALLGDAGCTGLSRVARDPSDTPRIFTATATLEEQPFEIHLAAPARPRAPDVLVLYASGDGGWFGAAADMFRAVAESGYYAVGLSTKALLHRRSAAGRPLTLAELAARYRVILDTASSALHLPADRRVVLTGWSRGASLGVLLGEASRAPAHLAGVIAIGLAEEENLTISSDTDDDPAGPRARRSAETLDMYPLIARIAPRRCALIQATGDGYLPAARARDLFGPDTDFRRFYAVKASNHRFGGGAEAFIESLRASLEWVTGPASPASGRTVAPTAPRGT